MMVGCNFGKHFNKGSMMNKSEQINELAAALAKAQGQIKGALRDSSNPFFKSKYADLSSVVEAIREAFSVNGLSYVQRTEPTEANEVRVETILLHASGQWLSAGTLNIPVSKADAQGFGSALTYARRYGLSAATGVAPEDDDGNAAAKAAPTITPTAGVWDSMSTDEQTFLGDLANEVKAMITNGNVEGAKKHIESANLGSEEKIALWTRFDSKQRAALKAKQEMKQAA